MACMKTHTHTHTHTPLFIIVIFILHRSISLYISLYQSIYLSIYLSVCLSVCLSIYLSIYVSIYLCPNISSSSIHSFINVSIPMGWNYCLTSGSRDATQSRFSRFSLHARETRQTILTCSVFNKSVHHNSFLF